MKNNKIIKIMIIVIAILAVIGGILAYIVLATDLLKTDAQLFAKYGEETLLDLKEFFNNESMNTYYEKKISNNHENKGSIEIQAKINDANIDFKDTTLTFYGAVDVANKKANQNINLNYSNKETFAFEYVRNNDLYALTSAEVVNKYIAIDNNNLKDLVTKFGIADTQEIPNKITLEDYKTKINKEKLQTLQTKYMNIITEQLTQEDFSKVEGQENAYSLIIRNEKLKNTITNILLESKNEPSILDIFETERKVTDYQENIDKIIEQLKKEDFSNKSLQITVEKVTEGLAKVRISMMLDNDTITIDISKTSNENISININVESDNKNMPIYNENQGDTTNIDEINIEINKKVTANDCTYSITANEEDKKVTISAVINGISTNQVKETYNIQSEQSGKSNIVISYNNLINFNNTVNITELDDDNAVILNTYNTNDLISLTGQLIKQIENVHVEKMTRVNQQIINGEKDVGVIPYINNYLFAQLIILNKAKEAVAESNLQIEKERITQETYEEKLTMLLNEIH